MPAEFFSSPGIACLTGSWLQTAIASQGNNPAAPRSREVFDLCCGPFHSAKSYPETSEELLRCRGSAHIFGLLDRLASPTHPDVKTPAFRKELERTIDTAKWRLLTFLRTSKEQDGDKAAKAEFAAELYHKEEIKTLHSHPRFRRFKGMWKHVDDRE